MEAIIQSLSEAGIGLGSLMIIAYLLISQFQRQDKMNKAYIETLAVIQASIVKIQADSDKNWKLTQDIADIVKDSAKALSNIKCLR